MVSKKESELLGAHMELLKAQDLILNKTQMGLGTRADADEWEKVGAQIVALDAQLVNNPNMPRRQMTIKDLSKKQIEQLEVVVGRLVVKVNKLAGSSKTYSQAIQNGVYKALLHALSYLEEASAD